MSVEEVEEVIAEMDAVPTCTARRTADEEAALFRQKTGLSEQDIIDLADTSFVSHEVDLSGLETAEAGEEKEAAEEVQQDAVMVEPSFEASAATTMKEQAGKPMGQSSLMAAAAIGEEKKSGNNLHLSRQTGATAAVQQDAAMERTLADTAASTTTVQAHKPMGQSSLMAAAVQGEATKSAGGSYLSRATGAAGSSAAATATTAQQAAATTARKVPATAKGSGISSLAAAAAAAGTANRGRTGRKEPALEGTGSRVFDVEQAKKSAAAAVVVDNATTVPVAERVQQIEERDTGAGSGQTQEANTTTNEPVATTAPGTSGEAGKVAAEIIDVEMEEAEDDDGFDLFGPLSKVYPKPKPARKHMFRYDIKLDVAPCEAKDSLSALSKVLLDIWTALRDADKKLVIYPWKEGSSFPPLQKTKEMPTTLPDIARYFDRAFPRKAGGTTYVSVYLGHEKAFNKLHEEVSWWFTNHGFGWYLKALQCERSMCIGWLLYSTLDMDKDQLADEIRRTIGVKVGLRFRTISVNSKQKLSKDQMVPAIHIEIDERHYARDKDKISQLYESKKTDGFPLGIKMRLCPQVQDATDPATATKFDRVRIRQAAFLANVIKTRSFDIGVLDFQDPLLNGRTLRSMVMNIRSTQDPEKHVFISVDKDFRGSGVCYSYSNHFAGEAPAWIRGLLSYVKSLYPVAVHGQLEKCFSTDAVIRAASCRWDPVKNCVVSAADTAINTLYEDFDIDDEFEFPDTDTSIFELDLSAIQKDSKPAAAPKQGKSGTDPYDADSVSTFKSQREAASKGFASTNQYAALAGSADSSVASTASGASSTTDGSRGTANSFKTAVSSAASEKSSGQVSSSTESQASSKSAASSKGSSKSGKSTVSNASAVIIEQRNRTISDQNSQIQAIEEQLRDLQAKLDSAENASGPNPSQQPEQASLDNESMQVGDGNVSGSSL